MADLGDVIQKEPRKSKAPKKGSVKYWFYMMIPGSVYLIFTCITPSIIIFQFNSIFLWIIPVVGVIFSIKIVRRNHRSLINMPFNEYEKCFSNYQPTQHTENDSEYEFDRHKKHYSDTVNFPNCFDPSTTEYYTYGPGSSSEQYH